MVTENTDKTKVSSADIARRNTLIQYANAAAKAAVANGDIPTAILHCEQILPLDPENTALLSDLGALYLKSGNKEHAVKLFDDAYALAPQDQNIRNNYLETLSSLIVEQTNQGHFAQTIPLIRKALSLSQNRLELWINLANALEIADQRAELADFMPGTTATQLGKHALIACMPKSGSTFLKETLCALTDWPEAHFAYAYLQNEQEIFLPSVQARAYHNTVAKLHCRATGPNIQILQAFDITPIVLVRKLPDAVVSLCDFYDNGALVNTFFSNVWPKLDKQGKYDLIIDHVMPWYAGFYASWEQAQRLGRLNCLFITYREMIEDKPAILLRISDFLGLRKTPEECAAAVRAVDGDPTKTRFNKGIVGRGDQTLSAEQMARLRRLVTAYGDVDLERIGMADSGM